MNPVTIIYRLCRLCAELKPSSKQLDLQYNSEKRSEITQKLKRVNAPTEFDSMFPNTVCSDCVYSLDKSFDFVVKVESAQLFLNDFIHNENKHYPPQPSKQEPQDEAAQNSEEYYFDIEVPSITDHTNAEIYSGRVNTDDVHIKTEPNHDDIQAPVELTQQSQGSDSVDSIPLSQLKRTWESYSWRCTYCETIFPTIDDLQSHSLAAHSCCNPYRCSDCAIRKAGLDKFIAHVISHHKRFKHSCFKCFKKFNTISENKKHIETHFGTKFSCPGCKTSFATGDEHKIHKEKYFKIKEARLTEGLTCLRCIKTFQTGALLKNHLRHMHMKNYVCQTCGKAFNTRSRFTEHASTHTNEQPFKCLICKAAFKTSKGLEGHVGRHYDDRPFCCDKCGCSFRLKRHLKTHSVIHSDSMPFQCSYCVKRFQRKEYLNIHERFHTGETPYSCEMCHHSFSNWPNYNKHMKQKHNIDKAKKKPMLIEKA